MSSLTNFFHCWLYKTFFKFQLNLFFTQHRRCTSLINLVYPWIFFSNLHLFRTQTLKLFSFWFFGVFFVSVVLLFLFLSF